MENITDVAGMIIGGGSVWFLIGAALVFFMNCGFAMLETGFTRAKNAGNILMKNVIDFSVGTVCFTLLGFSLLAAEDYFMGIIGIPNLGIFTDYANFDYSDFVFNLVFCATAATIVSGAMAERTKFSAYCIYSAVISLVVYPIQAGWVWNEAGWLAQLGFIDFAGSMAIHAVGGLSAFIGAAILGARIGKYAVDPKTGKKVARAIPGHSLTLGALGMFILWFGWYGFNGAAAADTSELGSIFLTTTISPALATVTVMIFTWIRGGKPDVSLTLNAPLAGLAAITAPCASVNALGAGIIGIVAGILVVLAVEFIDRKLHVDDPVGAVSVHFVGGVWGTLAVGLFAIGNGDDRLGLFYGGGLEQLGVQLLGAIAITAWVIVTMTIAFTLIKKFHGLRVSHEDEIMGLDLSEHGLISSYADFMIDTSPIQHTEVVGDGSYSVPQKASTVEVIHAPHPFPNDGIKFTKVDIIARPSELESLKVAMNSIGITGMTVTNVMGYGMQKGSNAHYRGVEIGVTFRPKIKLEIVVCKVPIQTVIETAKQVLHTGNVGDGKIFVYDVENIVKIRTGEEGYDALQDVK